MKRIVISAIAFVGLFFAATLISNLPVRGGDSDRERKDREREDEHELEVQQGLSIAPVPLNLDNKDVELVGLGSYIVNAQGSCNDLHTCLDIIRSLHRLESQAMGRLTVRTTWLEG